jgi:S-adenosylmethionine-diacylgycerolhomoserine-N-methlytransferase
MRIRFKYSRQWMRMNHVKMEGHLLPEIETFFAPVFDEKHPAYGELRRYMLFIGKRNENIM